METFEILCVTMHQKDFSKLEEMNIHSNVVFSNQADHTDYQEKEFDGHKAKMITTDTRGVGKNRNLGLIYASGDICLFADDDVRYVDNMEELVLGEFEKNPKADIIIFHFNTDSKERPQGAYKKTRRHGRFERMPWGGCRIAFRLNSIKKRNLWFSTLFGGGCIFPSGEDSKFFIDAKRAGLKFYVSNKTIGSVSFAQSTWYTGVDEKYFFAKGVFYQAVHRRTKWLWMQYFAFRTKGKGNLSYLQKIKWMKKGAKSYDTMTSFDSLSSSK